MSLSHLCWGLLILGGMAFSIAAIHEIVTVLKNHISLESLKKRCSEKRLTALQLKHISLAQPIPKYLGAKISVDGYIDQGRTKIRRSAVLKGACGSEILCKFLGFGENLKFYNQRRHKQLRYGLRFPCPDVIFPTTLVTFTGTFVGKDKCRRPILEGYISGISNRPSATECLAMDKIARAVPSRHLVLTPSELQNESKDNRLCAYEKYFKKVVKIRGIISEFNTDNIKIVASLPQGDKDYVIACYFNPSVERYVVNTTRPFVTLGTGDGWVGYKTSYDKMLRFKKGDEVQVQGRVDNLNPFGVNLCGFILEYED